MITEFFKNIFSSELIRNRNRNENERFPKKKKVDSETEKIAIKILSNMKVNSDGIAANVKDDDYSDIDEQFKTFVNSLASTVDHAPHNLGGLLSFSNPIRKAKFFLESAVHAERFSRKMINFLLFLKVPWMWKGDAVKFHDEFLRLSQQKIFAQHRESTKKKFFCKEVFMTVDMFSWLSRK